MKTLTEYEKDPRKECKYGTECYQKNSTHHDTFKHPPPIVDKKTSIDDEKDEPVSKKLKISKEESIQDRLERVFLTKMPQDFFKFYDFCSVINKENPELALMKTCNLKLVGPYDLLSSKSLVQIKSNEDYLTHWRYYSDPPEFQTILAHVDEESGEPLEDGLHFGYFRDEPDKEPVFVASGSASSYKLIPRGENVFASVYLHVVSEMTSADPFRQTALQKLKESIHTFVSMKTDFSLEAKTRSMKSRDKSKVATPFHGAGMVVPYNKETMVGYREIPESTAALKKIFQTILDSSEEEDRDAKFDVLQELVTNVQFANDEGDPGMGLELGLNLFSYGGDEFHRTIEHLLTVAYTLLQREAFEKIIKAHLKIRAKGRLVEKCSVSKQ